MISQNRTASSTAHSPLIVEYRSAASAPDLGSGDAIELHRLLEIFPGPRRDLRVRLGLQPGLALTGELFGSERRFHTGSPSPARAFRGAHCKESAREFQPPRSDEPREDGVRDEELVPGDAERAALDDEEPALPQLVDRRAERVGETDPEPILQVPDPDASGKAKPRYQGLAKASRSARARGPRRAGLRPGRAPPTSPPGPAYCTSGRRRYGSRPKGRGRGRARSANT